MIKNEDYFADATDQDCSMVLDSRVKGKECWPIRKHVLCLKCNRRRQDESEPEESDGEE